MEQLPLTIIFTILLGALPLLSIMNTLIICKLNNIKHQLISLTFSGLLLLPAVIIVLSMTA